VFWLLAIVVTGVACAALYYAARGQVVNATAGAMDSATTAHFRLQLKEIETDIASGRLNPAEGQAARAEMARELVRLKQETAPGRTAPAGAAWVPMAVVATAILAFGVYFYLGEPEAPSMPLASRQIENMTLEDAIARIELQLTRTPDDLRGWVAIAPAYMQLGRFADAERAFRRIIELDGPSADRETDLGEALMMGQGGNVSEESLRLFRSAAERDPSHLRSRFYLASAATRSGEFQSAIAQWTALVALAEGDEPWLETARAGLAAAEEGLNAGSGLPSEDEIAGMVEGLAVRLASDGGTLAEWTQLVRSRLVLGQTELAQDAYEAARAAYPDAANRTELDVLAADNGLVANDP
jgi:cytochrome c-type biogenesis protein CcmH